MTLRIEKVDEFRFRIPRSGAMKVPGLIFASESMIGRIERERVAEQVANVAAMPGIVGASLAMPDCHWGYGMAVGGVAAMDVEDGVISPGAVGYDISCGMRLLRSDLREEDVAPRKGRLMDALNGAVASGVGKGGRVRLDSREVLKVLERGARWAVERGWGDREDLEVCEDGGCLAEADPEALSERAVDRGKDQAGTLGSGNHFVELQVVDAVYDPGTAAVFGLFKGQVAVMIHTGSRGLGYQVCSDSLKSMQGAMARYGIRLADRQLACAPLASPEGKKYFGAMCAAANYARANREIITHTVREVFQRALERGPADLGLRLVYDLNHNMAKVETHSVDGKRRKVCVHRKGATRAYPAGHPDVPESYRGAGQPVIVPGSMGTESYVLVGTQRAMDETFGTVCHGAGRLMSRTQAARMTRGRDVGQELEARGISVRTDSWSGIAEEAPAAYKDVSEVVDVCHGAGISRKVARLRPVGVLKG